MKIIHLAAEYGPLVKVGGLADVVGSLTKALKDKGLDVSVILPYYGVIKIKKDNRELIEGNLEVSFEGKKETFNLWKTEVQGERVPVFLIENKRFSSKNVYPEKDASSGGGKKEAEKFLFLSKAAKKVAKILKADILHCHDWHVGITPYFVRKEKRIKTLLTIHNLKYQGKYKAKTVNRLLGTNLKEEVNCLKLGIKTANLINTVSPSYSEEILTKEFGSGLEGILKRRKKDLSGILNGLDIDFFNPQKDKFLKKNYSFENLKDKKENKKELQKEYFEKQNPNIPILGMVTRLADQKGIDLVKNIFEDLIREKVQFILLGKGNKEYERFFKKMDKKHENFSAHLEFNEKLAHQIYGGADIFLMPSEFEPCGLGQMIAMRYGTIPVVRATGGLKDTVISIKKGAKGTGFLFKEYKAESFLNKITEAFDIFEEKKVWSQIQKNGMKKDFSWKRSAQKYIRIYQRLS